jgi:hypothetical protein
VDDTPHTACTTESVSRQQLVTIALKRPRVLDTTLEPAVVEAPPPPTLEVSTKDYRRAKHGRKR